MGTLLLLGLGAYGYYVYSGSKVSGEPPQVGFLGWGDKWRYYFMIDKGVVYKQSGSFKLNDYDAQSYAAKMIARDLGTGRNTSVVRFDYVDGAWRRA